MDIVKILEQNNELLQEKISKYEGIIRKLYSINRGQSEKINQLEDRIRILNMTLECSGRQPKENPIVPEIKLFAKPPGKKPIFEELEELPNTGFRIIPPSQQESDIDKYIEMTEKSDFGKIKLFSEKTPVQESDSPETNIEE